MFQGEQICAPLVADDGQVGEAARHEKGRRCSLALEQRVGAPSGREAEIHRRKGPVEGRAGEESGPEHGSLLAGEQIDRFRWGDGSRKDESARCRFKGEHQRGGSVRLEFVAGEKGIADPPGRGQLDDQLMG